ncbi:MULTISPECIES: hybrid sensor histidine kinase/response regulator [unclassified Lentimicrobium]|uniref:hybrid sensor histidine kinase/response regulator n=1 Tax=unclassified Lentimicrobium TaxID=2677434 RepID=UPI001554F5D4|nr:MULTISPECIES: hybrid sensor histidine kinase/response regulator [unclassified Lentimicrobium]NPD48139.1 hybrid sensor histidine kinase/response regulator [Lentimicrobium sp. S6]NPD86956.1 hybrid sensor histidine kinase/response regulator [Lentimicrobium sp. L6]
MKDEAHILVVDDNKENLKLVGSILKENGYKIAVALDGESALKTLKNNIFELILLDVMMPGIDGFEVCRRIKSDEKLKEIPVIFLTAKNQKDDLIIGFDAGGIDYVTKPFNKEELLARVSTHIELKQSRDKLIKLNATKDRLFSIIGHDLRGPIGTMMQISEMMSDEDGLDKETLFMFIDSQKKLSKSTFQLLENLLNWAKSQRNEITFVPEKIMLKETVLFVTDLFKEITQNKQISIAVNIPQDTIVFADKNMLMTVLRNLISNAIKFSPNGKQIRIFATKNKMEHTITINDEGEGITPENLSKLFKNTEHITTYGTNGEKGSGLGLILCKEFVEKHDGKIWAESEVGKGTDLKFTLPLCNV